MIDGNKATKLRFYTNYFSVFICSLLEFNSLIANKLIDY